MQLASFSDLPVELSEPIIKLAAEIYADTSKATLASLALTSRAIRALVQPTLSDTVIFDDANAALILDAASSSRAFAATRRLIVAHPLAPSALADLKQSASAFANISAFAGPPRAAWLLLLEAPPPNMTMLVITATTTPSALLSQSRARSMRMLTHLHVRLEPRRTLSGPPEDWPYALTHVLLEVATSKDDASNGRATRFLQIRVRKILALPSLQRLLVRLPPWAGATWSDLTQAVLSGQLNDPRLWCDMEQKDHISDSDSSMFDPNNWLSGEQMCIAPASE